MSIVNMKRVSLLAHQDEKDKVVRILRNLGSVELLDVKEESTWTQLSSYLVPDHAVKLAADLENKLGEVRYSLEFLKRHFPVRKNLLQQLAGAKINLSPEEYETYIRQEEQIMQIYLSCRQADEGLMQLKNDLMRSENLLEELRPWVDFEVPLAEVTTSERVCRYLMTVPTKELPELQNKLEEEAPDHCMEVIKEDKELVYCFLIHLREQENEVKDLLKEKGVNLVSFPNLKETVTASINQVQIEIEALGKKRTDIIEQIEKLLIHRPQLMAYYDHLQGEISRYTAVNNFVKTESSFFMEGWIPAPCLQALESTLAEQTETSFLVARDPEPDEKPPVLMHNGSVAEAHEFVTNLYSTPKYGEIDPTPLLTPFFIIFFGICLGDVGYGAVISLITLAAKTKLKLTGMTRQLVNLLFIGGLSSIFFGILMGSYFGDLIKVSPLWFNPLDNPMQMLIFCFVLGIIQIYFGLGVKAYRSIKDGQALDALFDQGSWAVFLAGLMLLLVGINPLGKWLSLGGAISLLLTQGRTQIGIFKKFFSGLLSLYNVTGYLSDLLSYSRLMALGLATGVIGMAINTMGGLLAKGIIGTVFMVVFLIGGHFFNLLISALGSFIHTSRLQYIEFFGKFFEGGGKLFRPFGIITQYVEVEEREA